MANEEHLEILKQGVEVWNKWREEYYGIIPDLRSADLRGMKLNCVNLSRANLCDANLSDANLSNADLTSADLARVNLSNAILFRANLFYSNLIQANLIGTNLSNANITSANLTSSDMDNAILIFTTLGNIDLSTVKGLETINHFAPSTIGIDTIYRSKGNIPESFLRGAGVPENFIVYMKSLVGEIKAIEYYSCFIAHSSKDKMFCERLFADLQAKGVRVWYFPESAKWGKTIPGEIDRAIKIYDKLIVVCSEYSLNSEPVIREIERAIQRENEEHKHILFPIRLDDYLFDKWEHERKADVVKMVAGNFRGWDKDASKYNKAFKKLMDALEAED